MTDVFAWDHPRSLGLIPADAGRVSGDEVSGDSSTTTRGARSQMVQEAGA